MKKLLAVLVLELAFVIYLIGGCIHIGLFIVLLAVFFVAAMGLARLRAVQDDGGRVEKNLVMALILALACSLFAMGDFGSKPTALGSTPPETVPGPRR